LAYFGESKYRKTKAHLNREGLSNRYGRINAVYWQVCITTSSFDQDFWSFLESYKGKKKLFLKQEKQAFSIGQS